MKLIKELLNEKMDVDCGYVVDARTAAEVISRVSGREIQPENISDKMLAEISHAYQQAIVEWIQDTGIEVNGFTAPSRVWDVAEEISKTI